MTTLLDRVRYAITRALYSDAIYEWMLRVSSALQGAGLTPYVANITALEAVDPTGYLPGAQTAVGTLRCYFAWDPSSTETADAITIVAHTGLATGRWIRDPTADPQWAAQTHWYIDAVAGNDENDGSVAHPLRTHLEFRRRLGTNLWAGGGTLTILTDLADDDLFLIDYGTTNDYSVNTIRGLRVTVLQGSLATFVQRNPAANQQNELTSAAVPDWSAYIGENYRIQMTSGDANSYNACIVKNTAGTARVSSFAYWTGGEAVPAAFDTFRIYSIPRVHKYAICPRRGNFNIQDLYLDNVGTDWATGTTYYNGFIWQGNQTMLYFVDCNISLAIFWSDWQQLWNCFFIGYSLFQGTNGFMKFGAFVAKSFYGVTNPSFDFEAGERLTFSGGVLFQGAAWMNRDDVYLNVDDAAVFDSPSSGVHLERSGHGILGTIYGSGNVSYGVALDATSWFIRTAGGVQAITGSGDVLVYGTPKTWGALPYDDRGLTAGSIAAAL